jgi:hypothetical protein
MDGADYLYQTKECFIQLYDTFMELERTTQKTLVFNNITKTNNSAVTVDVITSLNTIP